MLKRMFQTLAVVVSVAFVAAPALSQIDPGARERLEESAETIKQLKGVSFKGHYYGTGMLANVIDIQGEVQFIRVPQGKRRAPMYLKGSTLDAKAGQGKRAEFYVSSDGRNITAVIPEQLKVLRRPALSRNNAAFQMLSSAQPLVPEDFFKPQPYDNVLGDTAPIRALEIIGAEKVGDALCEIIEARMSQVAIRYYISPADLLPRRIENIMGTGEDSEFKTVWDMRDMKVMPKATAADMQIDPPAGYEVDEQGVLQPRDGQPSGDSQGSRPAIGLGVGETAPDFTLTTADGNEVTLSALTGQPIVLYFWNTRSASCEKASAVVRDLEERFDNVRFLGMTWNEDAETVREAIAAQGLDFPTFVDADSVRREYRVRGAPSYCVIKADRTVVYFGQGFPGEAELSDRLTKAIRDAQ